jgi:hypothetical protein
MSLRRRQHHCRAAMHGVTVALAAAVALVFTPCCELFAAIDQGAAGPTDVRSAPGPDSGGPAHNHAPWHTAHSYAPPLAGPVAVHRSANRLSRAGPPLYLRFAHLLI